jgi:hypothetical protein
LANTVDKIIPWTAFVARINIHEDIVLTVDTWSIQRQTAILDRSAYVSIFRTLVVDTNIDASVDLISIAT